MSAINACTTPVRNVLLGWCGYPVPPVPKQRNLTRASYRKTPRRRPKPQREPR